MRLLHHLQRKAGEATSNIRESALETRMSMMTPEERDAFAATAAKIAAEQNAQAAEVEVEVEEVVEAVEEAAEEAAEAVEEQIEE